MLLLNSTFAPLIPIHHFAKAHLFHQKGWLLLCIGLAVFSLEIWMVVESALVLKNLNGEKMLSFKQLSVKRSEVRARVKK